MFLKIRDTAKQLTAASGAVQCGQLLVLGAGDCWEMLACVERLVELGEPEPWRPALHFWQHH